MAGFPVKASVGHIFHGAKHFATQLGLHTDATVLATTTINGPMGTWTKTGVGEYTYTLTLDPSNYKVAGAGYRASLTATGQGAPGGLAVATLIGAAASTFGCEWKTADWASGSVVLRIFTKGTGAAVDCNAALQVAVMGTLFDASVGATT